VPVNPVIETDVPSLSDKTKVVVAEKYVPPVITVSFIFAILQRAFALVTPPTPSIVDPVHTFTKF